MAGKNSFMTSLLELLDDVKFFEDVTIQPFSGTKHINAKDYLILIEELLDLKGDQGQSNRTSFSKENPSPLSSTINKLCCQITCEALNTNNARQTIKSLLEKLSSFSWDAKAVLTLLALSVYYAENQHLAKIEQTDNKLGWVAFLRGRRPATLDFQGLRVLIRVTWEFTKCAVDFASYSEDLGWPSVDKRTTFCHIIVGVIGCSVAFSGMISGRNDFLGLDVSPFSDWIKMKYESFKKQVQDFKQEKEEELQYKKIKKLLLFGTDIVELMAEMFCTKNDLTVFHCSKKTTVKVELFKSKSVMLLISNLDLLNDDLATLKNIYSASHFDHSSYEIMWVPMVKIHNDEISKKFQDKRSQMEWYACKSLVSKVAENFIRKKWKFSGRTQVVVLNQQGRVENFDAMTMIRIWKIGAFPFKEDTGKELWRSNLTSWLKLLVEDTVLPDVVGSIINGELVLLYDSSEDSETTKKIEAHLKLIKQKVSFVTCDIGTNREKFLTRLEGCMSLKMQESPDVYDSRTEDLVKLYTSYKHNGGFAILARGSSVVISARLTDFEKVLSQHDQWIQNITAERTIDVVLKAHYDKVIKTSCHRFYIPITVGNIPEIISCGECNRCMKTSITFDCCHGTHDNGVPTPSVSPSE